VPGGARRVAVPMSLSRSGGGKQAFEKREQLCAIRTRWWGRGAVTGELDNPLDEALICECLAQRSQAAARCQERAEHVRVALYCGEQRPPQRV
jgi:hypothetical protein